MQWKEQYPLIIKYTTDDKYEGRKLGSFLKEHLQMSRSMISRLKFSNKLSINGKIARINDILSRGDRISADLYIPDPAEKILPEYSPLCILYEDEHIISLLKQAGICTHPVTGYPGGTVANHLKHYFSQKNLDIKIRPVSRLDKDTTGGITFAKNAHIQERLRHTDIKKEYLCLVHGVPKEKTGTINAPVARKTFIERYVAPHGLEAVTNYEVMDHSEKYSLVKATIFKGKTHQIRLHMSYIGHPVAGDWLYGIDNEESIISRQALHAYRITFIHPIYNYNVIIQAPIPADLSNALERCGLFTDRIRCLLREH